MLKTMKMKSCVCLTHHNLCETMNTKEFRGLFTLWTMSAGWMLCGSSHSAILSRENPYLLRWWTRVGFAVWLGTILSRNDPIWSSFLKGWMEFSPIQGPILIPIMSWRWNLFLPTTKQSLPIAGPWQTGRILEPE